MAAATLVLGPVALAIVLLVNVVKWVILAGLLIGGMRGINYAGLLPLNTPDELWDGLGSSIWTRDARGRQRPAWVRIFSTPVILSIFVLLLVLNTRKGFGWPVWQVIGGALALPVVVFAGMAILGGILSVVGIPVAALWDMRQTKRGRERERRRRIEAEQFFRELEAMTCAGYRGEGYAALSRRQRTVRLRFDNLKSKVCRPYAG